MGRKNQDAEEGVCPGLVATAVRSALGRGLAERERCDAIIENCPCIHKT